MGIRFTRRRFLTAAVPTAALAADVIAKRVLEAHGVGRGEPARYFGSRFWVRPSAEQTNRDQRGRGDPRQLEEGPRRRLRQSLDQNPKPRQPGQRESPRFTQPYPESLPTICARRAIHTGFRTWPFRDWHPPKGDDVWRYGWLSIPKEQITLAEILKGQGYQTMFVTDTLHQFKPSYNFHRGFDVFHFNRGQTRDAYRPDWTLPREKIKQTMAKVRGSMRQYFANTAGRKTEEDWFAPQVFMRSSELLEAASQARPFFMVVDGYDPHYTPREGSSAYLTERQLKRMRALYSAEVTMADRWLGRFLDKIDELGLFENTLIILLSDHGHALGEHKKVGKPVEALWPELTDIVFLVRHPEGKGAGQTSDYYASTHDVAPTILGMLAIEPPEPMDGQDLPVILGGGEPERRDHFSLGYHNFVWARDETYVYFSRNDGAKAKLYDVRTDPKMRNDRAKEHPEVAKRMFEDYVLRDAGGPLPRYRTPSADERSLPDCSVRTI